MLEIALTICSIHLTGGCRDMTLPFVDEGQLTTPYACMMQAQGEIAKWVAYHPNEQVKSWTCQPAGRFAKI